VDIYTGYDCPTRPRVLFRYGDRWTSSPGPIVPIEPRLARGVRTVFGSWSACDWIDRGSGVCARGDPGGGGVGALGDMEAVWADSSGCDGCWCFNHHIAPGEADVRGGAARDAKRAYVSEGRAQGVVAYVDGKPAGWCAVDRGADIPGHDCVPAADGDDEGVWYVHCFYVHPAARGRGVATAMLRGTLDWLGAAGPRRVEGFPTPKGLEPLFGAFNGPFEVYEREGFVQAAEDLGEDYCRVVRELGN